MSTSATMRGVSPRPEHFLKASSGLDLRPKLADGGNIDNSLFCLFGLLLLCVSCCALPSTYLQLETEMCPFIHARTWAFVRYQISTSVILVTLMLLSLALDTNHDASLTSSRDKALAWQPHTRHT